MTVAVVWREESFLWAVADTRISRPGSNGAQSITDHGPKILPLPVVVRQPGTSGFYERERVRRTLGFVYAGATGPALSAHALCAAALQNLIIYPNAASPSLAEIAAFVARNSERYMRDWGRLARRPTEACFTALIFGWCDVHQELQVHKITPKINDQFAVCSEGLDVSKPIAIGTGAQTFGTRLDELYGDGDPHGRTARLPLLAVESLVASQDRDDVGGDIQIAYATRLGLQVMTRTRPRVIGQSAAYATFLGIDADELGSVGHCRIGLTSLA